MEDSPGSADDFKPVVRTQGVTPAERYLARLCARSFLRLWSYSGVYRDQGGGHGKGQGKEVCDLLVVFDEHVLIFSDKDCEFKTTVSREIAWSRWIKKAIFESVNQVFGAERWIKDNPSRLFLDRECITRFPIPLPSASAAKFHRIVVAHRIAQHCREALRDDIGSLMLNNTIRGLEEHQKRPFQIGQVAPDRGFVHVFDDAGLEIVLGTLDTVADFTAYLEKKERFLTSGTRVAAAGEEDLLAYYLRDLNDEGEHDFIVPSGYSSIAIDKGFWRDFSQHQQRKAQIAANERSYAWDGLIETFITHTLNGTQRSTSSRIIAEQEKIFRWMAREPRTRRRILANALLGLVAGTPSGHRATRIIKPSFPGDPYYLFLVLPKYESIEDDQYRDVREGLLQAYCQVLKLEFNDAQHVIGIATETGMDWNSRSEDALYIDFSDWTPELATEARKIQRELDILTHTVIHGGVEQEYPDPNLPLAALEGPHKISRNAKCPCGKGLRYRKCCGKKHYQKKR